MTPLLVVEPILDVDGIKGLNLAIEVFEPLGGKIYHTIDDLKWNNKGKYFDNANLLLKLWIKTDQLLERNICEEKSLLTRTYWLEDH